MSLEALVLLAVVGARFVVPLYIPRFPLPAIVAALVLDAVDQTVFQVLGLNPPGYQGYDKAMDVYYLAIAYLSTLRNWTNGAAVGVASFLYFYRLVGVVAFELTAWRPLLLLFPNTFEYFFIAYELLRLRRNPQRFDARFWWGLAAAIWVGVKLPQEWWIHIAKLDVTEELGARPLLGVAATVALVVLFVALRRLALARLPAAEHPLRLTADPFPQRLRSWQDRAAWMGARNRVRSRATAEKVALVGLIGVIFAQVLPSVRSSDLQLFLGLGAIVVVNAAITLAMARRSRGTDSMAAAFAVRIALNIGFVVGAEALLGREGGDLNLGAAIFFVVMLSLLTLLDDRFRPLHEYRRTAVDHVA